MLYYTKGSGSNGVNTVYFLDTTGQACPNGVGLPATGASLPASPLSYDPSTLQANGLPSNMYVADEGNDTTTFSGGQYTAAAAQTTAGLQKWVFDGTEWKLAYTLQAGLNLGQPYAVRGWVIRGVSFTPVSRRGASRAPGQPWL